MVRWGLHEVGWHGGDEGVKVEWGRDLEARACELLLVLVVTVVAISNACWWQAWKVSGGKLHMG